MNTFHTNVENVLQINELDTANVFIKDICENCSLLSSAESRQRPE